MSSTITRRTLTRGAAWTLPVVTVAAAAPAYATSQAETGPVTFTWYDATWSAFGTGSYLIVDVGVDNRAGSQPVSLLTATIYTTYHAPATNVGQQQTVSTHDLTGTQIAAGSWEGIGPDFVNRNSTTPLSPPRNGTQDITVSYYNGTTDGTVPCTGFVKPSNAAYPHFAQQLVTDQTSIAFTYAIGGVTYVGVAPAIAVPARVIGNCTSGARS
jgi:hypothetical protein